MGRRVKQADGRYCYTENCRIHDRGSVDAVGYAAVADDLAQSRKERIMSTAARELKSVTGGTDEQTGKAAEEIVNSLFSRTSSVSPWDISEAIKDKMVANGLTASGEGIDATAYNIQYSMMKDNFIAPGDEVILKETGERGVITEGNAAFGGKVRFNPESSRSRNSFAWFDPSEVTKLGEDSTAPARVRILAQPRDELIPSNLVRNMFVQETSEESRNPQALKEVGRSKTVAVQAIREYGEALSNRYKDTGLTRRQLVDNLNKEYQRPVEGKTPAQVRAIKSGIRNIINYLEGVK